VVANASQRHKRRLSSRGGPTIKSSKSVGLTAGGAIAIAFAVLLEGSTSGDLSHSASLTVYQTAAVTLALGGVLYFYDKVASQFGPRDGADRVTSAMASGILEFAVQFSAIVLAWRVCARFEGSVGRAFLWTIFIVLTAAAIAATLLRAVALLGLRWRFNRAGRTAPMWLDCAVKYLTSRDKRKE
jgi:hypothetical protein